MIVERLQAVLEATGLAAFNANMAVADKTTSGTNKQLRKLAEVSKISTEALQRVKMTVGQATETSAVAETMKRSVSSVTDAAIRAADHLDRVKMGATQAAETTASADVIDRKLKDITGNANEARRSLESVRIASAGARGGGGMGIGGMLLPAAIGLGAAAAPALGPAMLGLGGAGLAGGATAIGGIGTAYLAFSGLSKAIGGNKQAFDRLNQSQKNFVQTLRGLHAGLAKVASNAMLPGLTKALHEMFSSGFVKAMTVAVTEFGSAMGDAGQIIGRYFGSGAFTSLVKQIAPQAAGGFKDLAHVFVSVADALGHVTEAALPMVNWLGDATVKGAALFDTWAKGAQASGGLAHAFDQAKSSMQIVGGLFMSLIHVIAAFGSALYPVSNVLVKNLTNGLDSVAKTIDRWKPAIQAVVGGTLSNLIATVKLVSIALGKMMGWLSELVGRKAAIIGTITGIAVALALLGKLNPWILIVSSLIIAIGEIKRHWTAFKAYMDGIWKGIEGIANLAVYGIVQQWAIGIELILKAASHIPFIGHYAQDALNKISGMINQFRNNGVRDFAQAGADFGTAWSQNLVSTAAAGMAALAKVSGVSIAVATGQSFHHGENPGVPVPKVAVHHAPPLVPGSHAWFIKFLGYDPTAGGGSSPFGTPPPFTTGLGPKPKKPKAAPVISGSALIPESLRSHLALIQQQFKADTTFQSSLSGQAADDYAKTLKGDLVAQTKTLQQETGKLKSKLASATGKQKTAIQTELTKVQGQLAGVQQQIIQNLQGTVQALQSQLSTVFGSVQTELQTALGNLYYQNGLQTPSEKLLSQMQAQDQLGSLQDAITQATAQLATDKAGALMRVVLDTATGAITNIMDPAKSATLAADQKALDAANRQLQEYNLSIKAAQERSDADSAYARQVAALNDQLAQWENAVMNGKGSIDDLRKIAASYGIQITQTNVPDFKKLSDKTKELKGAFQDLIGYIGTVTGKPPTVPPINDGYTPPAGTSYVTGGGANRVAVHFRRTVARSHSQKAASSLPRPGGTLARIGKAGHARSGHPAQREQTRRHTQIVVNVHGSVISENDLVDAVYSGLLRKAKRNTTLGFT